MSRRKALTTGGVVSVTATVAAAATGVAVTNSTPAGLFTKPPSCQSR
ncbi:hypothetical protein [Streptomyces sp. SS8]